MWGRSAVNELTCARSRRMVSLVLDGEASPAEAHAAASHLVECERCRQFADGVLACTHMLRSADIETGTAATPAATSALPSQRRTSRRPSQSRRARPRLALVLLPGGIGLVVLISLIAFLGSGEKAGAVRAGQPSLKPSARTSSIEQIAARDLARDQAARRRMAPSLEQARGIARAVETHHRSTAGTRFQVTDVSLTLVVASLELGASGSQPARSIPADNGIHFAVCPMRTAMCAAPGRSVSRRASSAAGRVGLELALRTFLETPAALVVVTLPRTDGWPPTALVFERSVVRGINASEFLRQLDDDVPAADRLDRVVRRHLVALAGLASYSQTRDSLLAVPFPVAAPRPLALDEGLGAMRPSNHTTDHGGRT